MTSIDRFLEEGLTPAVRAEILSVAATQAAMPEKACRPLFFDRFAVQLDFAHGIAQVYRIDACAEAVRLPLGDFLTTIAQATPPAPERGPLGVLVEAMRTHRGVLMNLALLLFAVWLALLDRCLVLSSGVGIGSSSVAVLVLQATLFGVGVLLVNGWWPMLGKLLLATSPGRLPLALLLVFLFVSSPHLLSEAQYALRSGPSKAARHPFTWRDLSVCCVDPLSRRRATR